MKGLTVQQGSVSLKYCQIFLSMCQQISPLFCTELLRQPNYAVLLSLPPHLHPQLNFSIQKVLFISFKISYNGLILKPSPELNRPLTLLPEQSSLKCPRLKMLADYNGNINTVQRTKKFSFTFHIQLIQTSECISLQVYHDLESISK